MVQNTKEIPILPKGASPPMTEAKTVSISLQLGYEQVLDLVLQLGKEDKERLVKDVERSLKEEEKTPLVEEHTPKYNSTTAEEIKAGKSDYQPVGREYLQKLQEEAKKVWEDEPLSDAELNEQIKKHL